MRGDPDQIFPRQPHHQRDKLIVQTALVATGEICSLRAKPTVFVTFSKSELARAVWSFVVESAKSMTSSY